MKILGSILLAGLAIFLFVLMLLQVDFTDMSFSEAKFVVAVIFAVAISVVSATKGIQIIQSAVNGLVVGAVLYALIAYLQNG
ncbi:MAG: hypothetical protein GY845_09645 [Planctomycetes bacterium]|nr:hypothetical protein [Planctomycetota bacterium]